MRCGRNSMADPSETSVLVPGAASADALVLDEPLSLWGGLDVESGRIIDGQHPQRGALVTGTILCMQHGRGSSSTSSVLAEAIRLGTGPAGIVLGEVDEILVLGALVAAELYGIAVPVIVDPATLGAARTGDHLTIG